MDFDDDIDYSDNPDISDVPEALVGHFVPRFDGHDMERLDELLKVLRQRSRT